MDLRCENKKHGELIEDDLLEVKCNSRFCGAASGVIVLHYFNTHTGALVRTKTFTEPRR